MMMQATFALVDQDTGERIEIGTQRRTIRRREIFRSATYVVGFDPPSSEHPAGRVRHRDPNDSVITTKPAFIELIVEDDPAKIRVAVLAHADAREWRAFWQIFDVGQTIRRVYARRPTQHRRL